MATWELIYLFVGVYLITDATNWKLGLGVGLIAAYNKGWERYSA